MLINKLSTTSNNNSYSCCIIFKYADISTISTAAGIIVDLLQLARAVNVLLGVCNPNSLQHLRTAALTSSHQVKIIKTKSNHFKILSWFIFHPEQCHKAIIVLDMKICIAALVLQKCIHLLPQTSRTCKPVMFPSSNGSWVIWLSLTDKTDIPAQFPIYRITTRS